MTRTEVNPVLREKDEEECQLGGWASGKDALHFCVEQSTMSFEVCVNGEAVCYWGFKAQGALTASCRAWMLSTPAIEKYPVFAGRQSIKLLNLLLEDFYAVEVIVDPSYVKAIDWLRWLGFKRTGFEGRFDLMRITRGSRV